MLPAPKQIGSYHVKALLGEGGVGSVYLAEQPPPISRKVAIKLIKLGMDTREVLARFELERQALAMMSHPSIAKVLDAGETGTGRPYFVMEYVEGLPLTEYCDRNRLGIRDRLELFCRVCSAIQHAHGRGILHRDVKPSNLLVREQDGQHRPMVIDFGLAKVLSSGASEATMLTTPGQLLGTPSYMSPEQVELPPDEIDTRSDVYGLGVVLFELLTGSRPHERELGKGGLHTLMNNMQREETAKPSSRLCATDEGVIDIAAKRRTTPVSLAKWIRGDLDWITLKAIERNRERRYESVAQLREDVERFLNSEPVVARPPTAAYRFERFLKRNRLAVVAVLAAVLSMILGSGTSTFMYMQAGENREMMSIPIQAMEDLRASVSNAHLWFEEALAGDKTLDVELDVFAPFRRARESVEGLLADDHETPGVAEAVEDPRARALLEELEVDLGALLQKSKERWTKRMDGGETGGEMDQEFDRLFVGILADANEVTSLLSRAMTRDWGSLAKASIAANTIGLVLLLTSLILVLGGARRRA